MVPRTSNERTQAGAPAPFHPAVARWFQQRFEGPTKPQELGWPTIRSGRDTLIAAPTGSGKTLAAFLSCIDSLVREGLAGALPDETQVVYISPLKALSNDIQKNLSEPLQEISEVIEGMGLAPPEIRVLVRTGDTPSAERQAMLRRPPHILVTTPESFYILLTSDRGRGMLTHVRTLIVDEIHAVARDKRGSHLSLSLERLDALVCSGLHGQPSRALSATKRPIRIGLSATQKPIEEVARFLVGTDHIAANGSPDCAVINEGHVRKLDLALELPPTPLEAVCANKTWDEIYDRLSSLIENERTTLIFVNTRRLAERVAFNLAKRLGEGQITSHHGSLSREQRLQAEQRLKAGQLRALVATASLELGIDIGAVDLVCQLGSSRALAIFLQRVGRSGHRMGAIPRGRLFPITRDDLVECAALLTAVRDGNLDRLSIPEKPLDILAQQIVAATSAEDWDETALFNLCRRAYPYRSLTRDEFDTVVQMLVDGFASSRGRSGAYLHRDGVGGRIRGRRGAKLAAITSGGAIPETADYQVILEPQGSLVGTVNEDFAVESMAGDIFQLGVSSWRILRVEAGRMRVEDAHGLPPTIPFWLGEAPARTAELSIHVSRLRQAVADRLLPVVTGRKVNGASEKTISDTVRWLDQAMGLGPSAAGQIVKYLGGALHSLGVIPTQETIVFERFFDETGGMQLVIHSPLGARVNRAWGLALRKRFCRSFNFELQAAATDDAIVISLGPQHSFPLEDVFSYLHSNTAEELLVQALLAAPMFQTRWRWNLTRSLAVLRQQGGKKVPPPIQRMRSDDLLAAAFPDQAACAENVPGDIQIPQHPLVLQTVHDCLTEAMDVAGFLDLLKSMEQGKRRLLAKDTTEPSPLAYEILNAKPYAFLDDAPLEERRTQAVMTRRSLDAVSAGDIGALDPEAIVRVKEQAWPGVEDTDDLHDALVLMGYLTEHEGQLWRTLFDPLLLARRATRVSIPDASQPLWVSAERLPLFQVIYGHLRLLPAVEAPARERAKTWTRETALIELLRGRLEGLGPMTEEAIAHPLGLSPSDVQTALAALESQGFAMRGHFTPGVSAIEWFDRRLLARVHRYTLEGLRKQIEPATAADFTRFLFAWQHVDPRNRVQGPLGLTEIIETLQGFEAPAGAWETQIFPARMDRYTPSLLDELCLSGQVVWGRLYRPSTVSRHRAGPTRSSPITFLFRDKTRHWTSLISREHGESRHTRLSELAKTIFAVLERHGASFQTELASSTRRLPSEVKRALGELVAAGMITGDSFGNLRALLGPSGHGAPRRPRRPPSIGWRGTQTEPAQPLSTFPNTWRSASAGRWSIFRRSGDDDDAEAAIELVARQLLRRYGIVFHKLLLREPGMAPWRDILRVYRKLEARGEIRGGRFVAGFSGEQYALPEAIERLRGIRRAEPTGKPVMVSAVDPLNLVGITTLGDRVPAVPTNRVAFRDGAPIAARIAGAVRFYQHDLDAAEQPELLVALRR